jgi:flagellin-like hook-associated protein FlgL
MRADIAVLNQGLRNAADGISMIQTAEVPSRSSTKS